MYPQAELQPGTWLARWLAELHTTRVPVMRLAGWLAGGLAGWLAAAKRGPERPREAQRGTEKRSVERTSLSCAWLGAPHKQIYDQGGSPRAELRPGSLPTSRIMTRELAGCLAGGISWLASWLAGGLAGLQRPIKAQRGPENHREAERG